MCTEEQDKLFHLNLCDTHRLTARGIYLSAYLIYPIYLSFLFLLSINHIWMSLNPMVYRLHWISAVCSSKFFTFDCCTTQAGLSCMTFHAEMATASHCTLLNSMKYHCCVPQSISTSSLLSNVQDLFVNLKSLGCHQWDFAVVSLPTFYDLRSGLDFTRKHLYVKMNNR